MERIGTGPNASNLAAPSTGTVGTDLPAELSYPLQLLQDRHIFGPTLALLEASTYAYADRTPKDYTRVN